MSQPTAFDVWWATYRENVEPDWEEGAKLIARFAWDAATAAMRADLLARAVRQEAFAGPEYHLTEENRRMFRHAAAQLRTAAKG